MSPCIALDAEMRGAKGGIAFPGALAPRPGICVARGMKNLNEAVRMGSAALGRPLNLQTWENTEEFNMQPRYLKAGGGESLFTGSRLLLKHIPFQSIRAHRPLPLHHTVHPLI